MSSRFGTPEELAEFRTRLLRYSGWEEAHPVSLTPEQAIAALGTLYDLLPLEARNANDDPTYEGARKMMPAVRKAGPDRLSDLEKALLDVAAVFDAAGVRYMVIGGMANAVWGQARATVTST